ncbi:PAS domain-containing protein [Bacteroidales bacterium OttesenSCG-928-I21]|nr:PAS domain-containing protein [Bacteroidales bacterium OttesenSCG-928-I21]
MYITEEILKQLPFAVTACDLDTNIVYMNEKSESTFLKNGEKSLIGKSLFDCHGSKSAERIKFLLENGETNVYTIEKNGIKKLIYQCPWYKNNEIAGLVEISLIMPENMPHFIRS